MTSNIKQKTIPISEARAELPKIVDRVHRLHNHYFLTRRGRVEAVIMSAEEFESWGETLDILANKAEINALKKAEKQVVRGKGKPFSDAFGEDL